MYTIYDIKGLLKHMHFRGTDPEAKFLEDGTSVNTAGYSLAHWISHYLLPTLEHTPPLKLIAAWDGGIRYRQGMFPSYKAKRREAAKDIDPAVTQEFKKLEDAVKSLLAGLGAISVRVDGAEADDLIALIAKGLGKEKKFIYSVDGDLAQLEEPGVTSVFLKDGPVMDSELKGVPVKFLALYKSLVGDSSDEYPGVSRFGPKAWESVVEEYGYDGLEEIQSCLVSGDFSVIQECIDADPVGSKALAHAYDHREQWQLSWKLANLAPECCYGFKGKTLVKPVFYVRVPDAARVRRVLANMGCEDLFEDLEKYMPTETLVTAANVDEVLEFMDANLSKSPWISFDYETFDPVKHQPFNEAMSAQSRAKGSYVDVLSQEITGCSFNFGENCQHTVYFSINHNHTENLPKEILGEVFDEIKGLGIPLIAHNASFEEQVSRQNLDYSFDDVVLGDTLIGASHLNENDLPGLKDLSKQYLNYAQKSYADTLSAAGAEDMSGISGEQVLSYGCDDSLVTSHLYKLQSLVTKIEGSFQFLWDKEFPSMYTLNRGFETGVSIDYKVMSELAEADQKTIDNDTRRIRELLEKHCTEENSAAVAQLAEHEGPNLRAIMKHDKGYNASKCDAVMEETKLLWREATKYHLYKEITKDFDFVGTPKQITDVALKLGVDPDTTTLKSTAKTRISEYITELNEEYEVEGSELEEFLDLLGPAASQLNKREGAQYKALVAYGKKTLSDRVKTVKEGDELNFNSPKQNQELLYLKLGLPVRMRTFPQRGSKRDELGLSGSPATDEDSILTAVAEDCQTAKWKREILEAVLRVKEASTRFGLYYKPYPLWQHPKDGVIHPGILNCGTATRRPAGKSPNVLQISKGVTRTFVIPRFKGHVIVSPDFSGQELRITGSEAKDPVFIEAYTGGGTWEDEDGIIHPVVKDIHGVTACSFAASVLGREFGPEALQQMGMSGSNSVMDYDLFQDFRVLGDMCKSLGMSDSMLQAISKDVKDCRQMAKVVNFLILYVGQASTLSRGLRVPLKFAEKLMDGVFSAYPRLGPWQKEVIKFARQHGYVLTAYGNRKHLTDDIRSRDKRLKSRMERQAVNSVVQSCAADILKVVLSEVHKTRLMQETQSCLIAPVYDELTASTPIDSVFEYCERVQDIMNVTPPGHAIPMLAEVKIGKNWGEMIELGDRPSERKIVSCIEGMF